MARVAHIIGKRSMLQLVVFIGCVAAKFFIVTLPLTITVFPMSIIMFRMFFCVLTPFLLLGTRTQMKRNMKCLEVTSTMLQHLNRQ